MKRFNKILQNQSGIALITVILIISILIAAALELNRSSRDDIYNAANISDGLKLIYIAKSGFHGAAALLVNSNTSYDTLRDDWANTEGLSAQSKSLFNKGYFRVKIEDEQGKIPLHKLVKATDGKPDENIKGMLLRLLKLPEFGLDEGKPAEMVDAIIDWIDADENPGQAGAESSYYGSLPIPYSAKNAPLDCIEELLMVRGITNEIFYGTKEKPALRQFVTIYGATGKININTAPKMVLRALSSSITVEVADKMDEYRRGSSNVLSSVNWLTNVSGAGNIDQNLILVSKSNFFRIYATGVSDKMEQNIAGVIKIEKPSFQIVNWRQD